VEYTREPVVETIITPKEGNKLVIRSSKGESPEEYFLDSIEIVSFGNACFFRSLEKPRMFLLPVTDYEVLEVREARMMLKHTEGEEPIKVSRPKMVPIKKEAKVAEAEVTPVQEGKKENRMEKKRDRRRHSRRRRTKEEEEAQVSSEEKPLEISHAELPEPQILGMSERKAPTETRGILSSLLPPPPTLISETIARYRGILAQPTKKEEEPKIETAPQKQEEEVPTPDANEKKTFWDFTKELTGGGEEPL